jgi:hypothetical protein
VAAVTQRVLLEERVSRWSALKEEFAVMMGRFGDLSAHWMRLMAEKASLPKDGLSDDDEAKLRQLERLFVEQETSFGFRSFEPKLLTISRETYKPTREGYDIGFEASASDNIRIIWGYLNSLLELSRDYPMHHLGLLILDEPKQQDTKWVSFEAFVRRAASASDFEQQVVFATSEEDSNIREMLGGIQCQYVNFEGMMFRRLE